MTFASQLYEEWSSSTEMKEQEKAKTQTKTVLKHNVKIGNLLSCSKNIFREVKTSLES